MTTPVHRAQSGPFHWKGVDVRSYKREGSVPFRDVTRQVLFDDPALGCELRYFQVEPAGHTTLERHVHAHAVVILHGRGRCMVGVSVFDVVPNDLVYVPALAWHQFRAAPDHPLGFLCMVNAVRDRPELPSDDEVAAMRGNPALAEFFRA